MSNLISQEEYNNIIENKQSVVVQFTANWCGPCKSLSPVLNNACEQKNITYLKCDISENAEFAKEKKIMSIPFVEFINSGEVKESFAGLRSSTQIDELLGNVFD